MRKGWFKHADHVSHPTNDLKVPLMTRFRYVLTMVLDGVRFLELWGRRFSRFEKVGLNMHESPNTSKTREGWFKKRCETVAVGWERVG